MTIDDQPRDKNYNTMLLEKLQKQPYRQTNLTIMNILLVKKYYFLIKSK